MKYSNNYKLNSVGIDFFGLITIVFIILKLCGIIKWSWWWVFCPIWIPMILVILIVIISFLCICIGTAKKSKNGKQ